MNKQKLYAIPSLLIISLWIFTPYKEKAVFASMVYGAFLLFGLVKFSKLAISKNLKTDLDLIAFSDYRGMLIAFGSLMGILYSLDFPKLAGVLSLFFMVLILTTRDELYKLLVRNKALSEE